MMMIMMLTVGQGSSYSSKGSYLSCGRTTKRKREREKERKMGIEADNVVLPYLTTKNGGGERLLSDACRVHSIQMPFTFAQKNKRRKEREIWGECTLTATSVRTLAPPPPPPPPPPTNQPKQPNQPTNQPPPPPIRRKANAANDRTSGHTKGGQFAFAWWWCLLVVQQAGLRTGKCAMLCVCVCVCVSSGSFHFNSVSVSFSYSSLSLSISFNWRVGRPKNALTVEPCLIGGQFTCNRRTGELLFIYHHSLPTKNSTLCKFTIVHYERHCVHWILYDTETLLLRNQLTNPTNWIIFPIICFKVLINWFHTFVNVIMFQYHCHLVRIHIRINTKNTDRINRLRQSFLFLFSWNLINHQRSISFRTTFKVFNIFSRSVCAIYYNLWFFVCFFFWLIN